MKNRRQRPKRAKAPHACGAQPGNQNAFKHKYIREHRTLYADIRAHIRRGRELVALVAEL